MTTENDGERHVAEVDATGRAAQDFEATVEQAAEIFAAAGVPRSIRSIQRFCRRGDLDCVSVDAAGSERYLISRSSIERRIVELQQMQVIFARSGDATRRDEPPQVASGRDTSRPSTDNDAEDKRYEDRSEQKLDQLQKEIIDLKILNKSKDYFIEQLRNDRDTFSRERMELIDRISNQSHKVGELENKLLGLASPTREARDVTAGEETDRSHFDNDQIS